MTTSIKQLDLAIEGMTCASCVGRVERALQAVPGVAEATVNLATERATVRGVAAPDALLAAIGKAGYEARSARCAGTVPAMTTPRRGRTRNGWRSSAICARSRADLAGLHPRDGLAPDSRHAPLGHGQHRHADQLVHSSSSLTTLVLLVPGRRFYPKGFPALAAACAGHEFAGRGRHAGGLWLFGGRDLRSRACCRRARSTSITRRRP